MAMARGRTIRAPARAARAHTRARYPTVPAAIIARLFWRALFGPPGSGPRSYPREGFPEHELHQIMTGRRDRFDGLM
jgi:hypothetical protein